MDSNGLKRSFSMQKGSSVRYNGKLKDISISSPDTEKLKEVSSTSSPAKIEGSNSENESSLLYMPIIKQIDNPRLLPKYAAILSRSVEDGVNMDDLDQLQQDLEKLLSTCTVRNRLLRSETESIDKTEEKRDKKGKQYDKTSLKRKRSDEKFKYKNPKNGTTLIKKQYPVPVNSLIGDTPKQEVPKVNLPKNDTCDKFWNSIEGYCSDITKDDVAFLDNLIHECSKEIDVKIPELGGHYTHEWTEETLGEESIMGRSPKNKNSANVDFKKNRLNVFSSPITHRLLDLLIEQRVAPTDEKIKSKYASELNIIKSSGGGGKAGICMDRRLQKELVEQGILSLEDLPKITPEDEILTEIKKCQQELATVNEYNLEELNKLRTIVARDLRRQEIKEALDKVDSQVLDIYNKLLVAKQKHIQQVDDKMLFTEHITKDFENQADAILKQQIVLDRELSELSDLTLL